VTPYIRLSSHHHPPPPKHACKTGLFILFLVAHRRKVASAPPNSNRATFRRSWVSIQTGSSLLRIRCSLGVAYFYYYFPFPFTFTLATSCLYLHIPPYLKSGCSLTPSGRPPLTSRQHLLVQTKTYLLVSSIRHRIRISRGRWRRKQGLLWEYGGVISFVGGEVDFSCGVNGEAS
jgi:hypothetical protein